MGGSEIDPRAFGGLEATVKHLSEQIEKLDARIDGLEKALANMTALLNKFRGAAWLFGLLVAVPSFLLGAVAAWRIFA